MSNDGGSGGGDGSDEVADAGGDEATDHGGSDPQADSTGGAAASGCWEWRPGTGSLVRATMALPDGGVLAAGMAQDQLLLARLDVDGDVVWSAEPAGRGAYWDIVRLPSGAFAVMGTTEAAPLDPGDPLLHAYADDGTRIWEAGDQPPEGKRLTVGAWWSGGQRLLAVVMPDSAIAPVIAMFDESGARVGELAVASYGEVTGLTNLGDGFAYCGYHSDGESGTGRVEAYDAEGAQMWTFDAGGKYTWECSLASASDNSGNPAVIAVSLVDGESEWQQTLGGEVLAHGMAMGTDGTTYFAVTRQVATLMRGFTADGDALLFDEAVFTEPHDNRTLAFGGDRLYRGGYDGPLITPDGFVDCFELGE